jgi:leucyl/phenylalanyl-tRNA---protein transferase
LSFLVVMVDCPRLSRAATASGKSGSAVTRSDAQSSKICASADRTRVRLVAHPQRQQNERVIPWLRAGAQFPPIDSAFDEPNGLLVAGGDLSPQRVLDAYRRGIFPWYSDGQPILWWSPDPRTVLYTDEFKVPRSLRKVAKQRRFTIRVDSDFVGVIRGCAAPRDGVRGTWITAEMQRAYVELHRQGYAHSVEAWHAEQLVGGLYGIAIGRMFFGESMFALEPDASKVALVELMALLKIMEVPLIDCQQETAHLTRFGARPIPRQVFAAEVSRLVNLPSAPSVWKAAAQYRPDPP